MINERQQKILEILEVNGDVQLQNLKLIFPDVSEMTLRRDLINFENEGLLIRTYGGGVSVKKITDSNSGEEDAYSRRASEHIDAKIKIAQKVMNFIEKGRSIYFDAGSTIMCLAKMLNDDNFSIITSGANISIELVKKERTSVVFLGGLLNKNTLSVSGPNAISFIDTVNIDMCFMSASGFSIESGFTVSNIYECELKKKVIQKAKKVFLLIDSSKINKDLPFTFAVLEDIDFLITEYELPSEIIEEAKKKNVIFI